MRLPQLYQRQNGFLAVLAATISFAGCQDAVPVGDYVPDASLHPTNPGTKDGATSDRFIFVLPDVSAQVPDIAPPPGPDAPPPPVAVCGDGILNAPEGEQCDDGNLDPGDGCGSTCLLDQGWICPKPGEPCMSTTVCGDGTISGAEQCDDGNTTSDDGCNADCQV